MLFNSYVFILAFLPAAVLGFYAIGRVIPRAALLWLLACSLFFYGYWNPIYLALLLFSIGFNFAVGTWLRRLADRQDPRRWFVLTAAIAEELGMLGFFKYANFFVDNVNAATGAGWELATIVLPLGISFYTFQQIAYLVDTTRGEIRLKSFLDYATTVSFFPHLIAGPIILYREILPQFAASAVARFNHENFAAGLTFFILGLFKKVALADHVAQYASPVFNAAATGAEPSLLEAWGGALSYTLQLYFDFSGYCDMAIGLGLLFNIRLPVNFNSPYKAVNIIDFWRRWHITLSYFLRHYLYAALGGNRRGPARRYANILITMLLGGLWHGAGWTFVAWGALHGIYLVVNHAWHGVRRQLGFPPGNPGATGAWLGRAVTLLAVVIGWVFFRAESFDAAWRILRGMAGLNGLTLPPELADKVGALPELLTPIDIEFARLPLFYGPPEAMWIAALFAVALLAPNSQQIMGYRPPHHDGARLELPAPPVRPLRWAPTQGWAALMAVLFIFGLTRISGVSEFLYFQF